MIYTLDTLQICFEGEISRHELPALRGAIANKIGLGYVTEYHKPGDPMGQPYPLIQYKRIDKRPALVCVGNGVKVLHQYLCYQDWSVEINGRKLSMRRKSFDLRQHAIEVAPKLDFRYRIGHWLALNDASIDEYNQIPEDAYEARLEYLQRKLLGNIKSFAKGIGWKIRQPIGLFINQVEHVRQVPLNGKMVLAFDVDFSTNVSLPLYIGLGRGSSLGNGILRKYSAK